MLRTLRKGLLGGEFCRVVAVAACSLYCFRCGHASRAESGTVRKSARKRKELNIGAREERARATRALRGSAAAIVSGRGGSVSTRWARQHLTKHSGWCNHPFSRV
eukprot:2208121-Pyramimonas_sp.AAC.1